MIDPASRMPPLRYSDYNILIVDDMPVNLGVIVDCLEEYGFGTRVRLPVVIEGERTRPILDTGASNTYVDGASLGLEPTYVDEGVRVRGTGPGGEVVMDRAYFEVAQFDIAGHSAAPLTLTDRPRGGRGAGLLGLDVLDRFSVDLDFATGLARFRPATTNATVPSWRAFSTEGEVTARVLSPRR